MASKLEDLEAAVRPRKVEQALTEEARHRCEEIQRGEVKTQDSDDVFREARARLFCRP